MHSSPLDNDDEAAWAEKLAAFAEVEAVPDDPVAAMQELLLAHEQTGLHRVEDPDLVRVLEELRGIAHQNIADVFRSDAVQEYIGLDADGVEQYSASQRLTVRDLNTLPRAVTACIQSIKIIRGQYGESIEVKMYDKLVALDKLMRFHGAYAQDNEQRKLDNESVVDLLLTQIGTKGLPTMTQGDE